jgi:hypothetical protein
MASDNFTGPNHPNYFNHRLYNRIVLKFKHDFSALHGPEECQGPMTIGQMDQHSTPGETPRRTANTHLNQAKANGGGNAPQPMAGMYTRHMGGHCHATLTTTQFQHLRTNLAGKSGRAGARIKWARDKMYLEPPPTHPATLATNWSQWIRVMGEYIEWQFMDYEFRNVGHYKW